jgi:GMP synthase (glutamine-hydrolysing)
VILPNKEKDGMADVLVLQHAACEGLGSIRDALDRAGLRAEYIFSFEGAAIPADLGERRGLIVMGGPKSVYEHERYPFLREELRLIQRTAAEAKPILGICLGSQLLAAALGGEVTKGKQPEIGWLPVNLAEAAASDPVFAGLPDEFMAFHWHGDVFSLPPRAALLASSTATPHQAFRYESNAYGLLFHPEVTKESIAGMVDNFGQDLHAAGVTAGQLDLETRNNLPLLQSVGKQVFDRWTQLLTGVPGREE